jgi:N-acetylmuramoyl-L-alanine amidase
MSVDVFVGIGHGTKPTGVFDPGAVFGQGEDAFVEHTKAHAVVEAIADALARNHVSAFVEHDSGAGHDPNFVGSAATANAQDAKLAVEVHLNAGGGTGPEALFRPGSPAERFATQCSANLAAALGLPNRGSKPRTDLGFLNGTNMPACIPEVCFVDNAADREAFDAEVAGEAIAQAIVDFLGGSFSHPPASHGASRTRMRIRKLNGTLSGELTLAEALDALEERVKGARDDVAKTGEALEWGLRLEKRQQA